MIEIGTRRLSVADVEALADRRDTEVTWAEGAQDRIAASYRRAHRLAAERPTYGRSTGVGANRSTRIDDAPSAALALLRSHATSAGPLRSPRRVRAMLVVRLNQLAAGGSGVSPALAEALLEMLRADALPPVREHGSIGTGDLTALATTALTLTGELAATATPPRQHTFAASDALPLISSNAGTVGDAALAAAELERLTRASLVVAALTFAAVDGNPEAFATAVEQATPFPGAATVCRSLRALTDEASPAARIQDPYALRALPQVHGPTLDALASLVEAIEALAASAAENPVFAADAVTGGTVAHHAAFHAAYLATRLDTLASTLAQSATLSLARLTALSEPALTGLPAFLGDGTPGASGVMMVEYVAASALGDLRAGASPVAVQSVVLSRGVEEDASFASLGARQLLRGADAYRTVLACELLSAVRAVRQRDRALANPRLRAALEACAGLDFCLADRDLTGDLGTAYAALPDLAALAHA